MRPRIPVLLLAIAFLAGCGIVAAPTSAVAPVARPRIESLARGRTGAEHPAVSTTTTTTVSPVIVAPAVAVTGNAELDRLLPTLPSVLFEAGAHVHFGYNPVDCCHAGGYNPEPNDVWRVRCRAWVHQANTERVRSQVPKIDANVAGQSSIRRGASEGRQPSVCRRGDRRPSVRGWVRRARV